MQQFQKGDRILVAMSGGVDSSVVASLMIEAGYQVVGVTMRFWLCDDDEISTEQLEAAKPKRRSCCGIDGVLAARSVADTLNIPHYVLDLKQPFESEVLRPAWDAYRSGLTPNPCVLCNQKIKFGELLSYAEKLGAKGVATGHYAQIVYPDGNPAAPRLLRGLDRRKDQSYFLYGLNSEQLRKTLFPLGGMTKDQVRTLADKFNLPTAKRTESQDACLGHEGETFAAALKRRFKGEAESGDIIDDQGKRLGSHQGVHNYTIGQRGGLGVALGKKAWVTSIDGVRRQVTLSTDPRRLDSEELTAQIVNWFGAKLPLGEEKEVFAQIRYQHKAVPATLRFLPENDRFHLTFSKPERSITPGQAAVVYDGNEVLGGGVILKIPT